MTRSSKGVFLSYASEDAHAAKHICDALRVAGIEVWFDQSELRGGDAWDQKIRQQIRDCALFVPIISAHTQARPEGYFRLEWKLAVDRSHLMAAEKAFLVPVVVDATAEPEALVPTQFREVQWTRVQAGEPQAAFVDRIAALLNQPVASHVSRPERRVSRVLPGRLPIVLSALSVAAVVALVIATVMHGGWLWHKPVPNAETGTASAPVAITPTAISEKSVAVLPFADMSEKKDQEYFSDGLSEELINMLTTVAGLRVPARTSSFYFKGKQTTLRDIAMALRVSHVLEGSVRKSGNRLRIVAQLVDARTDAHVWSQTYDRELTDVFAVQEEIAATVVAKLKVTLLGAPPKAQKTDPKAHELYLQASYLFSLHRPGGSAQSVALLEQALAIDPDYSLAWQFLALVYMEEASSMERPIEDGYRLAREAVNKAIATDPNSARAYARFARIEMDYDGNLAGAARHIEWAFALDPTNVPAAEVATDLAVSLGRMDLAIAMIRSVVRDDPVNPNHYLGLGYAQFIAGRFDEAIANNRTALRLNPEIQTAHSTIGLALLLKGHASEALAEFQREPSEGYRLIGLPMAFHALRQPAKSDAALNELIQRYEKDSAYNIAYVLAFRGEADRAFQWLEKAAAYRDPGLISILRDPMLGHIHADPRWLPFLGRIGRSSEQLAAIRFDVKPLPQ